jgi:hypothetical protein
MGDVQKIGLWQAKPSSEGLGLSDPTDPSVSGWFKYLLSLPKQADDSAEQEFPESVRDSSVKNAYRHALGLGMLAQELGANQGGLRGKAAQGLAKAAGYGWEGLGLKDFIANPDQRTDTLHDLNANAIGIREAAAAGNREELAARLKALALQAPLSRPPGLFQASPGFLTRTER